MPGKAAKSRAVSVKHQKSRRRKTKGTGHRNGERSSTRRSSGPNFPRLYEKQRRFVEDPARYTLCEAGTKSGKTLGCAVWLVSQAWREPGTVWWWVAPSYAQAMVALELMIHGDRMNAATNKRRGGAIGRLLVPGQHCKVRRGGAFPEIALRNGTLIQFRTAAEPDRLYGSGVTGAVIDEASRLGEQAFVAVRSTLTMSRGALKIVGNPRGTRNWFYKLCQKAKAEGGDYSYHHLCSADNPFIAPAEIEDARRILPERIFRELYLGEAQEGEGQVFSHIRRACVLKGVQKPEAGHSYVIGWDPARKRDYSALTVFDAEKIPYREVVIERLTNTSFDAQLERVKAISERYNNAPVIFDGTSLGGDLLGEDARKKGVPAIPFTFTSSSKNEIINRMVAALERESVVFQAGSAEAEVALGEMELFEGRPLGSSGMLAYGAPEGGHDDTVMARCLALWGLERPGVIAQSGILGYLKEAKRRSAGKQQSAAH
jgi:phage FluMu gp28-like protein